MSDDDMTCPECGQLNNDYTSAGEPDAVPTPGAIAICSKCAGVGVFTETGIRKPTEEELEHIKTAPEFRHAMMGAMLAGAMQASAHVQEVEYETEHDGSEPHTHRASVLVVGAEEAEDGVEGLPEPLRDMLAQVMKKIRLTSMTDEIIRFVTPEIANHVLSSYGNEEASMPSVATSALISLIRLCRESDDQMLYNLNQVEDFHGYVLAIVMLAEKPGGMKHLETLAGLRVEEKESV